MNLRHVAMLLTAVGVLLASCALERVPRGIIEPLPADLLVAGEEDLPPSRVERWRLCMVIEAEADHSAEDVLGRMEQHLLQEAGWSRDPVGEEGFGTASALLRPDGGAGLLWMVDEYARAEPEGECIGLIRDLESVDDNAVLLHVYL